MENVKKFDEWMRKKVKNIYYADHEQMSEAYRIIINRLKKSKKDGL